MKWFCAYQREWERKVKAQDRSGTDKCGTGRRNGIYRAKNYKTPGLDIKMVKKEKHGICEHSCDSQGKL